MNAYARFYPTTTNKRLGISSQVLPSSTRPVFFLFTPPHCLKKKGTFDVSHWLRISITHFGSISLARGPDSPPTITQLTLLRFRSGSGPRSGSSDRNLIFERVSLRWSIRKV